MKSLVIGLGNPIMGDDAVGCKATEALLAMLGYSTLKDVEVEQFYRGGISLMERLIGYDRVLIIDSITSPGGTPGTVNLLTLDDVPSIYVTSPHDGSLKNAFDFARSIGEKLPDQVDILAVEIESRFEFSEELSPPVNASIPKVLQMALEWIQEKEFS